MRLINCLKIFTIMVSMLFIYGCASNPVEKFYIQRDSNMHFIKESCVVPEITYFKDNLQAVNQMRENGYDVIGYSGWSGQDIEIDDDAVLKARQLNSCKVSICQEYANTRNGSYLLSTPSTTYSNANVVGTFGAGTITTTSYGTTTSSLPYSIDRYDSNVIFYGLVKSFSVGLYVGNLSTDMKIKINSNKGVYVKTVVKNTAAYHSGIISGDIITQIGKNEVKDVDDYYHRIKIMSGQALPFYIIRGAKEYVKVVNIEKN